MIIFTYHTQDEYAAALHTIQQIGVDHEAQPDDLTIITDELTASERDRMTNAYKAITAATGDALFHEIESPDDPAEAPKSTPAE